MLNLSQPSEGSNKMIQNLHQIKTLRIIKKELLDSVEE